MTTYSRAGNALSGAIVELDIQPQNAFHFQSLSTTECDKHASKPQLLKAVLEQM
ncbi:hypothetical protein ROA7745_01540 [Roseovarius aestuarii]|uniref:Uncharacterized protein n=1 Tax=Roseovarius aestuarii TaxID=475083 RepID=A0A1X7BQ08_9RHOB|nr:hypothetical protein ROA7745_01540 [Roseovarius aestuarii]